MSLDDLEVKLARVREYWKVLNGKRFRVKAHTDSRRAAQQNEYTAGPAVRKIFGLPPEQPQTQSAHEMMQKAIQQGRAAEAERKAQESTKYARHSELEDAINKAQAALAGSKSKKGVSIGDIAYHTGWPPAKVKAAVQRQIESGNIVNDADKPGQYRLRVVGELPKNVASGEPERDAYVAAQVKGRHIKELEARVANLRAERQDLERAAGRTAGGDLDRIRRALMEATAELDKLKKE